MFNEYITRLRYKTVSCNMEYPRQVRFKKKIPPPLNITKFQIPPIYRLKLKNIVDICIV